MSSPIENDASYQVEPEILPPAPRREADLHWVMLAEILGESLAEQFDWVATTGSIQTFEHRETYRYIHVDGETGEFFDQQCNVISREEAMAHALPPAAEPVAYSDASPVTEQVLESHGNHDADDGHEPGLDAFTRRHDFESRPTFWPHIVSKLDRFATLKPPVGISRVVSVAKRSFLAEDADETDGGANGLRRDHAPEYKEPSLATFTRRTSNLQS